jgi:hypothetical protein
MLLDGRETNIEDHIINSISLLLLHDGISYLCCTSNQSLFNTWQVNLSSAYNMFIQQLIYDEVERRASYPFSKRKAMSCTHPWSYTRTRSQFYRRFTLFHFVTFPIWYHIKVCVGQRMKSLSTVRSFPGTTMVHGRRKTCLRWHVGPTDPAVVGSGACADSPERGTHPRILCGAGRPVGCRLVCAHLTWAYTYGSKSTRSNDMRGPRPSGAAEDGGRSAGCWTAPARLAVASSWRLAAVLVVSTSRLTRASWRRAERCRRPRATSTCVLRTDITCEMESSGNLVVAVWCLQLELGHFVRTLQCSSS